MADEYLTVKRAAERLRAAGYPDSDAMVRAAIDRGDYGEAGDTHYRTGAGYRMVKAAAIDAEIARRKGKS